VRTHFPNEVLSSAIPRSVRVSEAPSYGQTVMTWDPVSTGAIAYRDAAREIAERGASRVPMDGMNDFRADIEYGGASLHSGGQ
jgi:chromosome partitioning protein